MAINKHVACDKQEFYNSNLMQVYALHMLQVIGEALKNIPQHIKDSHPEIAWSKIIGMRNIIVHGYFNIDNAELWNTITDDLPTLKEQVKAIMDEQNWIYEPN